MSTKCIWYILLLLFWRCKCQPPIPRIVESTWKNITSQPDLGNYSTANQQPVDFGVWQAKDGSYQLEACIRNTAIGGHTRLFYRWEQSEENILSNEPWKPVGIDMIANTSYGEAEGGLQAPYVVLLNGTYHKFYGVWIGIAQATSEDGKTFQRALHINPKNNQTTSVLFSEFNPNTSNTRDPMLFAVDTSDKTTSFHLIYSAIDANNHDGVYVRLLTARTEYQSKDILNFNQWSDYGMLIGYGGNSTGNGPWTSECPFVYYHRQSGYYYLFRTQHYSPAGHQLTTVFASKDPMAFGIDQTADVMKVTTLSVCAPELLEINGKLYIFALRNDLTGHRFAELVFDQSKIDKIDL
eukprot:452740_1